MSVYNYKGYTYASKPHSGELPARKLLGGGGGLPPPTLAQNENGVGKPPPPTTFCPPLLYNKTVPTIMTRYKMGPTTISLPLHPRGIWEVVNIFVRPRVFLGSCQGSLFG